MKQDIAQVVAPRLKTVDLAVKHVRDCRQWVPVIRMDMRESPLNPLPTQTSSDARVLVDVVVIIVIDELVPERLPEDHKHHSDKKEAGESDFDSGNGWWRNKFWRADFSRRLLLFG